MTILDRQAALATSTAPTTATERTNNITNTRSNSANTNDNDDSHDPSTRDGTRTPGEDAVVRSLFFNAVLTAQVARRKTLGRRVSARQLSARSMRSADPSEPSSSRTVTSESTPLVVKEKSITLRSHGDEAVEDLHDEDDVTPSQLENIRDIIFGKGVLSLCLAAAPVALASVYLNWSASYVFWFNFVTMIPLASILGDFTEELALHTNETIGGLINASFGNAVEVVVAINALLAGEIRVVQGSLLGSIFSNLLLVLGCCFFFGGLKYKVRTATTSTWISYRAHTHF